MSLTIDQKSGKVIAPKARVPSTIRREDTFLNHSILLEERSSPNLLRWVVFAVLAVVVAFVVWASFAQMKEMAHADGEVVSSVPIQRLQHLEGGIVAEITMEDGAIVNKGDVLVRLETRSLAAEREQLAVRERSLALDEERLNALLDGHRPDFAAVNGASSGMLGAQHALYEGQLDATASREAVLEGQIDSYRSEIATLERLLTGAGTVLTLVGEEQAMRRRLERSGAASRVQVIEADLRHSNAQTEVDRIEGEIDRLHQSITETERRLTELRTGLRADYLEQRGAVLRERDELREMIDGLSDRLERTEITSPATGIIKASFVDTIGGVIAPGEEIAQIASLEGPLRISARINPRDIAVVSVGDPVIIRVPALDFAQLGGIDGRIDNILPTTFMDERDQPYFRAFIEVSNPDELEAEGLRLLPGMAAQVDVITGEKTLLEYLFKPLRFIQDRLFTER
jgi:membrane fusion protein, adhesin transport system